MKNPWIIVGVITVVVFGGALWLSGQSAQKNNEGVEIVQHVKGNTESEIVLEEFSDFQCPACASFQPVLAQIMEEYGDKIRLEYNHFPLPFHNNAQLASRAAEAAGQQGKFFEFHDLLFQRQSNWAGLAVPTATFIAYAEELELDVETFRRHLNSSLIADKVRDDLAEGRERNVTGTPTFYLNGEKMIIETFDGFVNQIALAVGEPSFLGQEVEVVEEETTSDVRFGL